MKYKIAELNHVALNVSNLEKSARFYEDIVGLESIPRPNFDFPGAWLRIGVNQELHLIARDDSLEMPGKPIGHFALELENVEDAQEWLESKGVAFRGPLTRPDGATQFFIEDPDGHVIELTGNLPA